MPTSFGEVLADQVYFQTDDAWESLPEGALQLETIDVRGEARGLRFITSAAKIEAFATKHAAKFCPFTLFGSGDFHHLSAIWTRQCPEPFTLLSFDNHPDWDIRPPRWSCGAWINRALENPLVEDVSIWGCGNFECNLPGRLLANRAAARADRLQVHPWAQEGKGYPQWLHPMTRETWRSQFCAWTESSRGRRIYVTIDLDCLSSEAIFTNWENGRFRIEDLVWALAQVRKHAQIIGGDLCGAWSEPSYDTAFQKLAGWWDHPKVNRPQREAQSARLHEIRRQLWPALTGAVEPFIPAPA